MWMCLSSVSPSVCRSKECVCVCECVYACVCTRGRVSVREGRLKRATAVSEHFHGYSPNTSRRHDTIITLRHTCTHLTHTPQWRKSFSIFFYFEENKIIESSRRRRHNSDGSCWWQTAAENCSLQVTKKWSDVEFMDSMWVLHSWSNIAMQVLSCFINVDLYLCHLLIPFRYLQTLSSALSLKSSFKTSRTVFYCDCCDT